MVSDTAALARRGFSQAQLDQLEREAAARDLEVRSIQVGGVTRVTFIKDGRQVGSSSHAELLRSADIPGRQVGGTGGHFEVMEPGFRKTQLTAAETEFVLPEREIIEGIGPQETFKFDPQRGQIVGRTRLIRQEAEPVRVQQRVPSPTRRATISPEDVVTPTEFGVSRFAVPDVKVTTIPQEAGFVQRVGKAPGPFVEGRAPTEVIFSPERIEEIGFQQAMIPVQTSIAAVSIGAPLIAGGLPALAKVATQFTVGIGASVVAKEATFAVIGREGSIKIPSFAPTPDLPSGETFVDDSQFEISIPKATVAEAVGFAAFFGGAKLGGVAFEKAAPLVEAKFFKTFGVSRSLDIDKVSDFTLVTDKLKGGKEITFLEFKGAGTERIIGKGLGAKAVRTFVGGDKAVKDIGFKAKETISEFGTGRLAPQPFGVQTTTIITPGKEIKSLTTLSGLAGSPIDEEIIGITGSKIRVLEFPKTFIVPAEQAEIISPLFKVHAIKGEFLTQPGTSFVQFGAQKIIPFQQVITTEQFIIAGKPVTSETFKVLGTSLISGEVTTQPSALFKPQFQPFTAKIKQSLSGIVVEDRGLITTAGGFVKGTIKLPGARISRVNLKDVGLLSVERTPVKTFIKAPTDIIPTSLNKTFGFGGATATQFGSTQLVSAKQVSSKLFGNLRLSTEQFVGAVASKAGTTAPSLKFATPPLITLPKTKAPTTPAKVESKSVSIQTLTAPSKLVFAPPLTTTGTKTIQLETQSLFGGQRLESGQQLISVEKLSSGQKLASSLQFGSAQQLISGEKLASGLKVSSALKLVSGEKLETGQKLVSGEKLIAGQKLETGQKLASKLQLASILKIGTAQKLATSQRLGFAEATITPIVKIPTIPLFAPTKTVFKLPVISKKALPGFDVFVKTKGAFKLVSPFPLARKTALGLGARETETAARTFVLRPTGKRGVRVSSLEGLFRPERFRRPRGKTKLPKGAFVERAKFAIDVPKEREEITFKGLLLRSKKKTRKKKKKSKKRKRRFAK